MMRAATGMCILLQREAGTSVGCCEYFHLVLDIFVTGFLCSLSIGRTGSANCASVTCDMQDFS